MTASLTKKKPIFIADRGFASYNFFAHALEKGHFFLVRAKDSFARSLLRDDILADSIDEYADIVITRISSNNKRLHPEFINRYRYVPSDRTFDYIEPRTNDEYPMSLRIIRFKVDDGTFQNIITNLSEDEFSADEIKQLYHLRWNIETSFRDLKHTVGAINFHSKKVEYIKQEIWARMILFNFCAVITTNVVITKMDTKHVYQVNFSMAMKICHHFLRLKECDPPPNVEALIGSYTLPVRLGRNYTRQHRFRLPAIFCYRFS